jgi:hypothetical protein
MARSFVGDVERAVRELPGVSEFPSQFAPKNAFWIDGREFLHFEEDAGADVRLTSAAIGKRRAELEADDRVEFHGSDWVFVRLQDRDDAAFAVELAREAIVANERKEGEAARRMPDEGTLAKLRRLHGAGTEDLDGTT